MLRTPPAAVGLPAAAGLVAAVEADVAGRRRGDSSKLREVPEGGLADYSLRLSQQVVSLEAQNLELHEARSAALASRAVLQDKVEALEWENQMLRNTSMATFYEGQRIVHQAGDEVKERQGEAMLLRHNVRQHRDHAEALAVANARLEGVAEKLQGERRHLQREVNGWEATTAALKSELADHAAARTDLGRQHSGLERHARHLAAAKQRSDNYAGERHLVEAQLRLAREELAAERHRTAHLREELAVALRDGAAHRADANHLAARRDELQAEAMEWRHAEGIAAAAHPALHGAVQQHTAAASNLRGRVAELEAAVARLQRELTRQGAENGALRSEWRAAKAEAQRWVEESAELAGQRHKAEEAAGSEGRGRLAAQQHLAGLAAGADQLRRQSEAVQGENGRLWAEVRHLEAENIILRSHVRGREAVAGR